MTTKNYPSQPNPVLSRVASAPKLSQIEETVAQKPTAPTLSQLNCTYKPPTASVNISPYSEGTGVRAVVDASTPGKNAFIKFLSHITIQHCK